MGGGGIVAALLARVGQARGTEAPDVTQVARDWRGVRIWTIGHSTRSRDGFTALLRALSVSVLVDVRTIPRSRHNPQFAQDALRAALHASGIRYVHLPALGGLRRARPDSPNGGWRNGSFRGFADYMLTEDFGTGVAELRALAAEPAAVMCAEAVPWRCHRSLLADALTVRGATVEHIMGSGRLALHRLTPFACVRGTRITYPAVIPPAACSRRGHRFISRLRCASCSAGRRISWTFGRRIATGAY